MENKHKSAKKAYQKATSKRTKHQGAAAKKRAAKKMSQTWNYDFVSPWV